MLSSRVSRRMFAPVGGIAAATMFVVTAAPPKAPPPPPPPKDCDPSKLLVRPRDLPIYSSDPPCLKERPVPPPEEPNPVRDAISVTRKELLNSLNQVRGLKSEFWKTISIGKAHTESTLAILRDEENANMRYGAIGGSAVLGLILGIRRGYFKKLFYVSATTLGMAAICYPEEASEYSAEGFRLAKRYYNIAYHLVTGVVKDMGVDVPSVANPVEIVRGWIGTKEPIKGPGSSVLLPPMTETPSHVVQLAQTKGASAPAAAPPPPPSDAIPMPPLENTAGKQMKA